jgi:hypothetical protein
MLPSLSPPPSPHLVSVCLLLLFHYLYLPFLILHCKFIDDLEIGALLRLVPTLHLLRLRSLPHPPPLQILMIYLLPYDEVSVLILNTLLLILFPIIVFPLACVHLRVPYPLYLFLPLISSLWIHLDGSMLWMRKCVHFTRIGPVSLLVFPL